MSNKYDWPKSFRGIGLHPRFSAVTDKETPFNTFLHYSDPTAREERTVFGKERKGLFYNYSDRLDGSRWREGHQRALDAGLVPKTALFFEAILNHFHGASDVNLEHVILGCNMSNGYDYLVFGYTYSEPKGALCSEI